jgi:hypothetical protein
MKRPKIHISTLLIALVLCALFVWLNVRDATGTFPLLERYSPFEGPYGRGWPNAVEYWDGFNGKFYGYEIALNCFFCVVLLTLAIIVCEWVIRQRSPWMKLPPPQLRLSTLMIITLLAALFLWLNMRERAGELWMSQTYGVVRLLGRGWPLSYTGWELSDDLVYFDWRFLALDVVICFTLLVVAAVGLEWATQRMNTRRADNE